MRIIEEAAALMQEKDCDSNTESKEILERKPFRR